MGVLIPLGIAVALVCWLLIATMLAMITEEPEQAPLELERADDHKIKVMEKWLEYEAQGCYSGECSHIKPKPPRRSKCDYYNQRMKEYERRDA